MFFDKGSEMTPFVLVSVLLGLALYLVLGMVLAHHTKLGSKYYPNSTIRLYFFWIFPVMGVIVWFMGILIAFIVDVCLFGNKDGDLGIAEIYVN